MITIYTDGSSIGNPGPGARAIFCIGEKQETHNVGGEQWTTNNRMELMAVIQALQRLVDTGENHSPVKICLDSKYVQLGITDYLAKRLKNGRKLANKKPVQNRDLWEQLAKLLPKCTQITWQWVKGHAANIYNNKVDTLARKEALHQQKIFLGKTPHDQEVLQQEFEQKIASLSPKNLQKGLFE